MKKLIAAIAILLAVSPAFAQTATPKPTAAPKQAPAAAPAPKALPAPEKRAVAYTDELKAKLHLTDDQYQKVLAVNTECIKRKDALKASGQKGGQGSKEISAYRKQQYQTILTPDQLTQLKAINAQNNPKKSAE
jgi:LAS superfamily LD-carboxypeptidase LdcB